MMKEKEEKREFWPLVLLPLWDIFWSTSSSPFYTYYIPFRSSGSQESNSLNGVQIRVETKKLWSLQENCTKLKENFAQCESRCEIFRTVQNHLLPHECHFLSSFLFSYGAKQLAKFFFFSETTSESGGTCETTSEKANQLAKIHPICKNPKSKFAWLLFLVRNGFAQCEPPLCHDYYSKSAL